ncbi:DNA-binding response regulator [Chrysosporum bergii ANA360D]|uniref:DNA-binding response regulator n=1 Tax=Chrysosporum bergii ANA360D TaxID=617107 RepID=A0AA43GRK7_9CYAN|nr:DNA-binding response regulator [Chrysosporum bergii]MDH6060428.1 DNA-binding response regulator [Chrysosporum bergii ANA360D]
MTTSQQQEILNLRELNLTPKQIARKLGIKVSEVNEVLQNQAQQTALNRLAKGELDPIYQCLANDFLVRLIHTIPRENHTNNPLATIDPVENSDDIDVGLGLVIIAREARYNRISFCSYLLDVWCLGVKDTIPPRTVDRIDFKRVVEQLFDMFPGKPQEVTLEVAQGIIFSACEYSESLGFQPHKDFEQSRSHIGEWDGIIRIKCGRNGKPCYVGGPHDDSQQIIETLRQTMGEGNFDFIQDI